MIAIGTKSVSFFAIKIKKRMSTWSNKNIVFLMERLANVVSGEEQRRLQGPNNKSKVGIQFAAKTSSSQSGFKTIHVLFLINLLAGSLCSTKNKSINYTMSIDIRRIQPDF